MKIAVVGCGAVGSYYGARLGRAGQETHFLLRSDYEAVRRRGVSIRSPEGDFHFQPQCARTPEEIGICDLVLIGLKTTANDQFEKLQYSLLINFKRYLIDDYVFLECRFQKCEKVILLFFMSEIK